MNSLEAFCEPAVLFVICTQYDSIEACVQFSFALPRNVFLAFFF